jgi:hypothetical protein
VQAAREATEASTRAAREAARISIEAFEKAISQAEASGKLSRETAEASIRAFEKTIGGGDEVDEEDEIPMKTLDEVKDETEEASEKEKATEVNIRDKIESRLEFLAKMYEARKARQEEEGAVAEDQETTEEQLDQEIN